MFKLFKRKPVVAKDEPSPWLNIEHDHDWLPVMNGAEQNCGLCFIRRKAQ